MVATRHAESCPRLIYDVGAENGDDSAYYLHRGSRVVAIEANPSAVEEISGRFEAEIREGQYVLLPVGISEKTGECSFWVCDDNPHWSSFNREISSRNGSRHHRVAVKTRPFRSILEEFGRSYYCKIDIEGNDNLCLRDFTPATLPTYVSVEVIEGDDQLRLLRKHGYDRFKIISQRSYRQPTIPLLRWKSMLNPSVRRPLTSVEARLHRYSGTGTYQFNPGSSGPFGEETHGNWHDFDQACAIWEALRGLGDDLNEWFDIHASFELPRPVLA